MRWINLTSTVKSMLLLGQEHHKNRGQISGLWTDNSLPLSFQSMCNRTVGLAELLNHKGQSTEAQSCLSVFSQQRIKSSCCNLPFCQRPWMAPFAVGLLPLTPTPNTFMESISGFLQRIQSLALAGATSFHFFLFFILLCLKMGSPTLTGSDIYC